MKPLISLAVYCVDGFASIGEQNNLFEGSVKIL